MPVGEFLGIGFGQLPERLDLLFGLFQQFLEECTPGYYNNEGKLSDRAAQNGFFGGGSIEFFRILREWRAAGGLVGLELR